MNENEFYSILERFLKEKITKVEIYNEFSLQHELGFYLRNRISLGYKVYFEKNISKCKGAIKPFDKENFCKKEIDIAIENEKGNLEYAIELKFPGDGSENFPSFMKDIAFMQQVNKAFGAKTYCLNISCNKYHYLKTSNYRNNEPHDRYDLFRASDMNDNYGYALIAEKCFKANETPLLIQGGKKDMTVVNDYKAIKDYQIKWIQLDNKLKNIENNCPDNDYVARYYLLKCFLEKGE